jgi:hypothetical protein
MSSTSLAWGKAMTYPGFEPRFVRPMSSTSIAWGKTMTYPGFEPGSFGFQVGNFTNWAMEVLRVPPIQMPTQNFILEQIWRHFCIDSWCPETKQNTQNFEIQVLKGTPIVQVFEILSRNGFHGVQKVRFSWEKCCPIYPRMKKKKNKTSNLNFALGLYGENQYFVQQISA